MHFNSLRRYRLKPFFYLRAYANHLLPYRIHRFYERQYLRTLSELDRIRLMKRVNYYLRGNDQFQLPDDAPPFKLFEAGSSSYRCDLSNILKFFPGKSQILYRFGDSTEPVTIPTLVKARQISKDSDKSVLMRFDSYRHYVWYSDSLPFNDKIDKVVWRGGLNAKPQRISLIKSWQGHHLCDLEVVSGDLTPKIKQKLYLSPQQQLNYKFILSIEGNDVATNLKWILASNSLCVMPRPTKESWFMEGLLRPWEHFVPVLPDFSDLGDIIQTCLREPLLCKQIIRNANSWCKDFMDLRLETAIGVEVMKKYFMLSGQL